MDNIFDLYSAKVDNNKGTEWDSNCYYPTDMQPLIHYTIDSVRNLKYGYSRQSMIITVTKGHSKW